MASTCCVFSKLELFSARALRKHFCPSAVLTSHTWDPCPWGWGLHVSSSTSLSYVVGVPVFSPTSDLLSWTNLGSELQVACLQSRPWPCLLGWAPWSSVAALSVALSPFAVCWTPCMDLVHHLTSSGTADRSRFLWSLPELCCRLLCLACSFTTPSLALPTWLPTLTLGLPPLCRLS